MMKRILPILMLLALLCGCGSEEPLPAETAVTTEPETVQLYAPSQLEEQTAGAVRMYADDRQISWIAPVSGGVLLFSGKDRTVLTLVTGIDGTVTTEKELPLKLDENAGWQITEGGIGYYDPGENAVVYLDLQLAETARVSLPEDISGEPAISRDGGQVFYCQGETVCAIETERMITRPVRTNTCEQQTLTGCYFDGAVVGCRITDKAGKRTTLYISGENGELLYKDNGVEKVYTSGETFFALRSEGVLRQYIYGKSDGTISQLNIPDDTAFGTLETETVLGQTKEDSGILLSVYSTKKIAAISLPEEYALATVAADNTTGGVWLLTDSGKLLHWSWQNSAVTEDTDYFGPVYTESAPDTEGLAACQERADALSNEFGVAVRVWEKALLSNDALNVTVEYQPTAINNALTELETVLREFPKNFLYKSVAGQIRICIVRDVDGQATGAYHWYDGDPFIVLSAGADIEAEFMDAFSYILDIHVLGNSPYLDTWESLNPAGFTYGPEMTVMAYLEGDTRAFASRKGMQSLVDDRAQIFYEAMQEDNAAAFRSETMQAKLKLLCQGIRDAWRLEKSEETFLWEQYLNESLASGK